MPPPSRKKDPDEGRVVVGVRIRPALGSEDPSDAAVFRETGKHLRVETRQGESKPFNFDHVLDAGSTQEQVYASIGKPAVDQVLRGYNGCIMAYGQTGSGKTFTLGNNLGEKQTGIIPRAMQQIFAAVKADTQHAYTVQMSYIQIYCEMIQDLLAPGNDRMQLREDQTDGVFIVGVTSMPLESAEDCLALLEEGNRNRVTAFTNMNAHSSRSHACLIVKVERRSRPMPKNQLIDDGKPTAANAAASAPVSRVLRGKLTLVDLAGSERIKKTGASGQRLNEAKLINLSLTCLGNVIHALSTKSPHVPYRDSKLTRLLQDSLGGNAKTSLIVTVAPSRRDIGESVCSLLFGQRAMKVHNFPVVNEEIDYKALCAKLQAQLDAGGDGAAWAEVEVHRLRGEVERLEKELEAAHAEIAQLRDGGGATSVGGPGGAESCNASTISASSGGGGGDSSAHADELKRLKLSHYEELTALMTDFEEQIALHAEASDEWAKERASLRAELAKEKADLVVALNETMERDGLLEEIETCLADRDAEILEKEAAIAAANSALAAVRKERDRLRSLYGAEREDAEDSDSSSDFDGVAPPEVRAMYDQSKAESKRRRRARSGHGSMLPSPRAASSSGQQHQHVPSPLAAGSGSAGNNYNNNSYNNNSNSNSSSSAGVSGVPGVPAGAGAGAAALVARAEAAESEVAHLNSLIEELVVQHQAELETARDQVRAQFEGRVQSAEESLAEARRRDTERRRLDGAAAVIQRKWKMSRMVKTANMQRRVLSTTAEEQRRYVRVLREREKETESASARTGQYLLADSVSQVDALFRVLQDFFLEKNSPLYERYKRQRAAGGAGAYGAQHHHHQQQQQVSAPRGNVGHNITVYDTVRRGEKARHPYLQ